MRDINKPEGDNLGGVIRFNFIPVEDIESIEDAVDGAVVQEVELKENKQWYCGYGTLESIGYSEPSEKTNNGELYKRQFAAFCPGDNQANAQLFNEMRNRRFVLDYSDSNGLRKLVGSIAEPLLFTSSSDTQKKIAGLAGSSITFYGDGTHKAYIYNI